LPAGAPGHPGTIGPAWPGCRADGSLQPLQIVPFQLRRFRLTRPDRDAGQEMFEALDSGCRRFGTRLEPADDGRWKLAWH
jgi:hypothetical protein